METIIHNTLRDLKLGEPQRFKSLEVFPLFLSQNGGPDYLTLKQALEQQKIVITETTEAGSVPHLKVINRGDAFVLLIDGEELMGAKQNRVLNTSILIKGHSEIVVPVSCTEQGRSSYRSHEFADSEVVMAPQIRFAKMQSVTNSLKSARSFRSDQGKVWDQISDLQAAHQVASSTGAMKDVYNSKKVSLEEYLEATPSLHGQRGLLACMNGKVIGVEVLSRASAYRTLHAKLIKSYALATEANRTDPAKETPAALPQQFLEQALTCTESRFESPGTGQDYRFESPGIAGSALVHDGAVIHLAFFSTEATRDPRLSLGFRRHQRFS